MREKVVLPKFNIPGQSSSWTVRALWGLGGLVAIQMAVFGLLIWKQQGSQAVAFSSPQGASVATQNAVAPAPSAALALAEAPGATPAAPTGNDEAAPTAQAGDEGDKPEAAPHAKTSHSSRHAHHASAHSGRLAKAGGPVSSKSGSKSKSKQPDALDDLLKRFK